MIIELPVGKSLYKISCGENEKEKVFELSEKLNQRVNNLSLSLKNADEKTLLVIAALMLQEEADQANPEVEENPRGSEEDIYNAVSDNMENISNYIEKLINKIQNY